MIYCEEYNCWYDEEDSLDITDTERLDWYEKNDSLVLHIGKVWYLRKAYGKPWKKYKSFRECIDQGINNERNTNDSV